MNQGITKLPLTVDKVFESPYQQPFETGDIVRSVNGIEIENDLNKLNGLVGESFSKEYFTYVVERNGNLVTLNEVIQNPPRITQVLPKSSAIAAGLAKGDLILSLNFKGFRLMPPTLEAPHSIQQRDVQSKRAQGSPSGCPIVRESLQKKQL